MSYRHEAKKAFVHVDSSKRVSKALLRKAAPRIGPYQVGDLISFQREQNADTKMQRWSPPSRIIGFERGGKIAWVICEGIPFALSTDRIQAANSAQTLAYNLLHAENEMKIPEQEQQSFVDFREPVNGNESHQEENEEPQVPLQSVPEGEEELYQPDFADWEQESQLQPAEENESKRPRLEDTSGPQTMLDIGSLPTESRVSETQNSNSTESRAPVDERSEVLANHNREDRSRSPDRLLDTWNRTGTTGRGLGILERKERPSYALLSFLADDRLRIPMAMKAVTFESKNEKKEKRGKTLNYESECKEIREGLDVSRATEWDKWKKFVAGRPCKGKELKQLMDEGHVPIPTRWVDVDRNAHQRREGGPIITPDYKSRLCGRGDLEGIDGLRKDSPTAEIESHNLLFSYAASNKLTLKTADISNAYFQADQLDRVLILKPPRTGIPDPEYQDGETMILARVPIYGTQDAGRKFWKRFREVIVQNKFRENQIAKALYVIEVNHEIKGMLLTHVDDLCWAVFPEYETYMKKILDTFDVRKVEEEKFRFCGKQVVQLPDKSVMITCEDATEQIGTVKYSIGNRKLNDPATEAEIGQMRSVIGSLGWVARQCRPDISYGVSRGQSMVSKATIKDLKETNQTLVQAMDYSKAGLFYDSKAISWEHALVVTVTDASFAQETIIEPDGREKPHRTQKAFMILLVDPSITERDEAGCHIWCWRSLTDKRVCRATLQGEAHGMLSGTEMGDRLRAIIADCRGHLPDMRDWQKVSSQLMRHLWLTDCESLVGHLKNPKNERLENVRLSIDLQGLKQMLWEKADGTNLDELLPEKAAENAVRWIDTSCMVVDCLTKRMKPDVMLKLIASGRLNLKATPESVLLKMRKKKLREAKKQEA